MLTASTGSLVRRILLTSTIFLVVAMALVALLLILLFNRQIEQWFDDVLRDQAHDLVAAAQYGSKGQLELAWQSGSPRFHETFSGWYWQIYDDEGVLYQSGSLPAEVSEPVWKLKDNSQLAFVHLEGPLGQPLRAVVQRVAFTGRDQHFHILVTGPEQEIHSDVYLYAFKLTISFMFLTLGLLLVLRALLIRELRPLAALKNGIKRIRDGRTQVLDLSLPAELELVQTELNHLINNNKAILERARLQTSNLSHALKNPISILRNQAMALPLEQKKIVLEQTEKLTHFTHSHLARARLAGSFKQISARTVLIESISELVFSLQLLYRNRGLNIEYKCHPHWEFFGDPHDLEEVLGNILDNACKWAYEKVRIVAEKTERGLLISIYDDGPGIPESQRDHVFKPGARLDESITGTGLGLNIAEDIVHLYGGEILLQGAPGFGRGPGLCVAIELPGGAREG